MLDKLPTSTLGWLWRLLRLGKANWQLIRCWWTGLTHRNKHVRVSCAQLIRVQYGTKYLLVPSTRIASQMQPPGGVVKVRSAGRAFLERVSAHRGDDYKFEDKDTDDLRVRVPGSELVKFLGWYTVGEGREVTPEREFEEELLESGILPRGLFSRPKFQKYRTKVIGPKHSDFFGCTEILVHEFFELDDLSEEQQRHLKTLQSDENCSHGVSPDAKFGWYTSEEIEAFGRLPDSKQPWRIGEHAKWMVGLK